MKKVQLERILQSLEPVPSPRADIEQYPTPAGIAAEVVFIAFARGDIADRRVLDLGCGNGVLAIAAKLLGAAEVLGADIDAPALDIAGKNAARAKVHIMLSKADVREVTGRFDTVLMNPPFGSQTKHADLPFLDHALELGRVLYTFHNAVTEQFIRRRIDHAGARITDRIAYEFPLTRTFPFQREETHRIPVVLFRVEVTKD